jgi:hypothetical protein
MLVSAAATRADTRVDGPDAVSTPASSTSSTEIIHYRLIRLPKGTIPTDADFVGTLDVPHAYLKWLKPSPGSTETKLGLEVEALYPEMTPLSGTYDPRRPRVTVEIGTEAGSDDAILAIVDFLKDKGMKHAHDRDDLCGYAMPEKLPGLHWFIPCNEHASIVALITCGIVCNLQTTFANRLAVRIVYPSGLLGESFAIRDAVARLISSFKPRFVAISAVPKRASSAPVPPAPATALSRQSGSDTATRDEDPTSIRIELLGPEWEDVPRGYSGVVPEKVVAALQIPRAYVDAEAKTRTSNILIAFSHPGMKPAADRTSRDTIHAIVLARREESRPSPYLRLSRDAIREPKLDIGGLCGFVDTQHPGLAGLEFYRPCGEAEPAFEITCGPKFNGRRPCSDYAFMGEGLAVSISYQIEILQHRDAIVDAVEKLILPWKRPSPEQQPFNDRMTPE